MKSTAGLFIRILGEENYAKEMSDKGKMTIKKGSSKC